MELTFRKGTLEDTESLIALLRDVREGMPHKDWLYLDAPDEVRSMMEDGTMRLWVAMDGDTLAAAFDLLVPGLERFNYGYDLDFSREELLQVINMDTMAVHPGYRGLGLQYRMIREAEESLREEGRRILLCTVHPENRYSLNNMLKLGYVIQKEMPMYGSRRYILRKDLP